MSPRRISSTPFTPFYVQPNIITSLNNTLFYPQLLFSALGLMSSYMSDVITGVHLCGTVSQTCPALKLLFFDSQYAKRPVITKLLFTIHFKVQSSTECPCLTSIGLLLDRFSLSRDTKDDHVWEGRDKPLSLMDIAKPNYGKGFKPKFFFIEHGSRGQL